MSLWRDFSSVGFPNFIGNKFFFSIKSWNFRAGLFPAVIQFLLDLTYILDLLIIFLVIRLLFLIANLHCKRSDVMAGCAGVSLTSWSPFAVSWNTPVFWEVSRWDFSALFPIWTRRQAETVCLSVPTELDLLPEQLLSLCSGETGLSVPLTTALIPTGCGGSQSRDEPTA